MKIKFLLGSSALLLLIASCDKDKAVTKPVEFTSTTYQTLGTFNDAGKPDYLLPKDPVSPALNTYITNTLPEYKDLRKSNPELLTSKSIADIAITKSSDVFISFLRHGAAYRDVFAFYTYPTNTPPKSATDIKTITYIFPNAGSGTPLEA